jgi:K+-transporting ATPase ATPase C chain
MKQVTVSALMLIIMTIMFGIIYPFAMTGIARVLFSRQANGSLVTVNGAIAGSELIGQGFAGPKYFHGRPSANNYDGTNSGGSNYGPTNRKLVEQAEKLAMSVRIENGLQAGAVIPSELVLASGSGLDPHISLESARIQVDRIAGARGLDKSIIIKLLTHNSEKRYWDLWGDPYVNVLKLNIALDGPGKN